MLSDHLYADLADELREGVSQWGSNGGPSLDTNFPTFGND